MYDYICTHGIYYTHTHTLTYIHYTGMAVRRDQRTGMWLFKNNHYKRGFLYKVMALDHLKTADVNPTLPELEMFSSGECSV
jgi:transcription elongation factor